MLWGTFSSHLSNPNILDYLIMKPLGTEQSPLNSWLLKPTKNTVNAWTLYTTDERLRYQLLMSIQDTANCPALHLQQAFASREGTSFTRLQWGKHKLVKWLHRSLCWLLTTTRSWTQSNMSQKEEKKAKQSYKIFPTHGSWPRAQCCQCPHKHRSHHSLYLPSTQVCGCVCSQPRCGPQQARALVSIQDIWGGSEGSTGSIRGLEEPSLMDKGCCVEGQNASLQHVLPILMLSMKLCHPHLGKKPENKYN